MTDEKQLSRNREQIVAELDALYEKATPGTWLLYTSNSWRRIGTKFDYREIIYPMRHRSDGHPDLGGPNLDHDLAFLLALKEAWPEIRTLLASSEMKFSKGELEALIDYHDFNDAAAEA